MAEVARQISSAARRQHGLITMQQLIAVGLRPAQTRSWVDTGRLERVHRGVFRLAGAPITREQQLLALVLGAGPGAVASHRAAARHWGVGDSDVLEAAVVRARRSRVAGIVHRSAWLPSWHTTTRRAIPVTVPARTLVDLGAVQPRAVRSATDRALAAGLCTTAELEAMVDEVARRGRAGVGPLRSVLDDLALGSDVAESVLELRMSRLIRDHGVPAGKLQHVVQLGGGRTARVDVAWPARRVIAEVDGLSVHGTATALQHDLARQNALVAAGWTVLRFTWHDVVRRPAAVATQLLAVLGTERAAG